MTNVEWTQYFAYSFLNLVLTLQLGQHPLLILGANERHAIVQIVQQRLLRNKKNK